MSCDWSCTPHQLNTLRYNTNSIQLAEQISAHAIQISELITLLLPLFNSFHSKLQKLGGSILQSTSVNSFSHQIALMCTVHDSFHSILDKINNGMLTLANDLTSPITWNEPISKVNDIALQQQHQMNNIQMYTSFASYFTTIESVRISMETFTTNLHQHDLTRFKIIGDDLIKERKTLLQTQYNDTISNIIMNNQNEIPMSIYRVIYLLAHTPRSLQGVFRQNSEVNVVESYSKLIGVLDLQTVDNIILSSVIRKFLRDLKEPIWSPELLQTFINITCEFEKDRPNWIKRIGELLTNLPIPNYNMLRILVALCNKISQNQTSGMNDYNISVCIALSIMVPKTDIQTMSIHTPTIIKGFEWLLTSSKELFHDIQTVFGANFKDVILPRIYYDVFFNTNSSQLFTKHNPKSSTEKQKIFHIGSNTPKSTPTK